MSLALNPLAFAAATLSLGAHVAVFGILLGDSTDKPTEVVHLVSIAAASALPSSPPQQQPTMHAATAEPPPQFVRNQATLPVAPVVADIAPAEMAPPTPPPLTASPVPIVQATPHTKPVARTMTREPVRKAAPVETASLAPTAPRQSAARAALAIETNTAVAPGNAQPRYPLVARKRGYEGQAVVRARVSEKGRVLTTEIAESSGYEVLDLAARDAVQAWRFQPATREGRAISGQIDVPIEFRLR